MVDLLLDPQIRIFVVAPILIITLLVMFGRHYMMAFTSQKEKDLVQVRENQALMRSRMLRMNGRFISPKAFEMRRQYFANDADDWAKPKECTGYFASKKRDVPPPNPMSDPSQMQNMMMGSMSNMVSMMVVGAIINQVFSGFVTIRVPFPLTIRFKPMLQRGIQLSTLSSSWVSSASFYFICLFGLRGVFSLILGPDNDADSMRAMQQQMMGAGGPPDPGKAFKKESEDLTIVTHKFQLDGVEGKLMASDAFQEAAVSGATKKSQ